MNRFTIFKIVVSGALVFTVIALLYFVFFKTEPVQNNPDTNGTTLPIGGDAVPDSILQAKISEILERPETVDIGSGSYIFAGGNDLTEIPQYQIVYYAPDQSFVISLLSLPLDIARKEAELEFLSLLEITQQDACKARVMVTTPYDVSNEFSGKELGLSFCPGSLLLN